jgi:hypothetical protein
VAVELREDVDEHAGPCIVYRGLAVLASRGDDGTEWPCAVAAVPGPSVPFADTPAVLDKAPGMDVELAPVTAVLLLRPLASETLYLVHDAASLAPSGTLPLVERVAD